MSPNFLPWDWTILSLAAILPLAAYLIGSIPTAWLLTRRRLGQDIRQLGDGNMGAENAARILGRQAGLIVAVIDVGKGLAALLIARLLTAAALSSDTAASFPPLMPLTGLPIFLSLLAGIAAVGGHCWPLWLRGRGGRGAATAAGALMALTPAAALPAAAPALVVLYFTRSSTRCLAAFFIGTVGLAAAYSYWHLFGYSWPLAGAALAMPVLAAIVHGQRNYRSRRP